MKKNLNLYVLFLVAFISVGCSSFSEKLDIAGIIDSTENWIFGEESNLNKEGLKESDKISENDEAIVEEFFPDISEIPQDRPNFEELDKSFFEEEKLEQIEETVTNSINQTIDNPKDQSLKISTQEEKNILNILKMREKIRLNIVKLLIKSDPLIDSLAVLAINENPLKYGNKVAIIQFPDNSIIPDGSAIPVTEEILKRFSEKSINLVGHASRSVNNSTSNKRKNMEISIARAETIKNMLINKGFLSNKIFISGKGDLEPLLEEVQKYGEGINRRVEIFISE